MTPFAGWEMPVQYSSIIDEHMAVRKFAGIFDVSHMGEIAVRGKNALNLLEKLTCNSVAAMQPGQVQYNAVLNAAGGLVDDITVYRVNETEYFIVANASNYLTVTQHLRSYAEGDVEIEDQSERWHLLAVQGPQSEECLLSALDLNLSEIGYFRFQDFSWKGKLLRISRTGYSGEDGFEIYSDNESGQAIWELILGTQRSKGLIPCGLGARDTLRLEALYPLYGHELNERWTPVESGIGWIVRKKSPPYLAMDRILREKERGVTAQVVPFQLLEGGVPREGYPVLDPSGVKIAQVLSGAYSPSLRHGIGTAFLPIAMRAAGTKLQIEARGRLLQAETVSGPFVRGSAKRGK